MLPLPAGREASSGAGASLYERHRPERTLLYQLVQEYYPALKAHLAVQGAALPGYVEQEFEDYLKCGRLEHGFLRVRCDTCHAEHLVAYPLKTPYRNGTTPVICEPLDFIARLAALVPKPRVNLTRFHGVFAPNSKHRALVTPAQRGRGSQRSSTAEPEEPTAAERLDDLGATLETGIWHRHPDLPGLRRGGQDHRLHRGPGGDREDPHSPR